MQCKQKDDQYIQHDVGKKTEVLDSLMSRNPFYLHVEGIIYVVAVFRLIKKKTIR
jgi:hypothetical protein